MFLSIALVVRGEPLDYGEASEDSIEQVASIHKSENYVAESPELHDPQFSKEVNDIMGINQDSTDMLKSAVKSTFGDQDPVEAMKKLNPTVPKRIEDPLLAEALLGRFDGATAGVVQKQAEVVANEVHTESSLGEDSVGKPDLNDFQKKVANDAPLDDNGMPLVPLAPHGTFTTKSAFRKHADGEPVSGTTTKAALTLEELRKAGAKLEKPSPTKEKSVAGEVDLTPRGFTLDMNKNEISVSTSFMQPDELQIWCLAVFFGVLIPMTLVALCSKRSPRPTQTFDYGPFV